MLRFLLSLLFLAPLCLGAKNAPILASMTWTEKDGFKLMEGGLNANDGTTVALANFTNAINTTGWSFLEVKTFPQFPDKVQVKSLIIRV